MALKVGDIVPNFTAMDTNGELFNSQEIIGKKPVVIYFYPKDNTSVCTEQACSFRDNYEDFKALGAEVIGISSDSLKSHVGFASKYKLPFILLSDSDKKIRKAFGVPNDLLGLIPGRVTYVADKSGIVIMVFNSMSGKIHIQKALQILKRMQA
ncbi:peroxiredoxin [Flavobacterium sp.]|uniref:peroxiredoxin n=1 Tax=Flavobacterium sp. TaxID=239 RepID=UPI002486DEE5|nr:peroxiredoxin [Flavobacterium sp.]MDI1318480.1 peroxiredoxin [Flavobacterium sp.]